MFGFGQKKDRDAISSWNDVINLLMGVGGAIADPEGGLQWTIKFKREKRSALVRIQCADVSGLGQVMYVTSRVCSASPANMATVLERTGSLLEGDVVVCNGDIVLRATRPIEGMKYPDVSWLCKRLASAADEFAKDFEK